MDISSKNDTQRTDQEGWTVQGKVARFNGGTLEIGGRKSGDYWSYTATVTLSDQGLEVDVEDNDDLGGGSYTNLDIPLAVLTQLMAN